MGLLGIIGKPFKKETGASENYLSLSLTPDKILVCIWTFNLQNEVEILGYSHRAFTNTDNLIHQAAAAIDTAAEQAKSDVSQTVFGLSHYWFEDGEPSAATSKILKNLAQDLELDPQAFISLASGLNHLLKVKESTTPSALLVGILGDFCEIHLVKNDKVVKSQTVKSQPTVEKILQLAGRLKEEGTDLPSRIIIYGPDEGSQIFKKLSQSDWHDLFVQEPRIDLVSDEDLAKSIAYAQAQDILGYEPTIGSLVADRREKKEKIGKGADELGFVEGEDVLLEKAGEESEPEESPLEKEPSADLKEKTSKDTEEEYAVETPGPAARRVETEPSEKSDFAQDLMTVGWLPKVLGAFKKRPPLKNLLIILGILLIIALIGSFVAAQTLTEAQVRIIVDAKPQEDNFNVSALPGSSLNASEGQIGAQEITVQASGNQKAVTTGSKKLGEYAHGEVTVLNWTTAPKNFASQAVIISKDGVQFTLERDIEVASRSASTPGQNKAAVKAQEFGTSGNIGAGNDFTFQQYDELLYSAHNDEAFSGGEERQITVVSQEDQDRLTKDLTDSLTEKAKADLKSKTSGQKLPEEIVIVKVLKKIFDKKVDEEASLLNLDMEVEASGIVYNESELKKLLAESTEDLPENLQAREENVEIMDVNVKRKDLSLNLTGKYQVGLVPKFNEDDLREKIAGKGIKETRAIIKEIPQVNDVVVDFSPNLPLFSSIPRNKSKITFKIESS